MISINTIALLATAIVPAIAGPWNSVSIFSSVGGTPNVIDNPTPHVCIPIGNAVEVVNDSSYTAFLYAGGDCSGGYDMLGVGGTWIIRSQPAGGLRLGSSQ